MSSQQQIAKALFPASARPSLDLHQILDSLHDGIVAVDADGVILYANSAYTRILNVPVERILGRNMRQVQPHARILKVLQTGEAILRDSYYLEQLGLDVTVSATPIFENGVLIGAVTVFRTSQELLEIYAAYRRAHGLVDYYRDLIGNERPTATSFSDVVGQSPSILNSIRMAAQVARTDATVLITGENGVGKDVLANAIHKASGRAKGPFIAVNSGAIPDSLLESELFGFDSGAFTGATRGGKMGKVELAHGGTLFLDEVGDMTPAMQAKLLRTLQNKEIEKLGSNRVVKVDVRVIAATHRDLENMVTQGTFRQDLLYRLNLFPISLAPLRERRDDIPRLAQHFLNQCCALYHKQMILASESFELLEAFSWPGNVRQLRNVIERAVIICDGEVLLPEHLGGAVRHVGATTESHAARIAKRPPPPPEPESGSLKGEVNKLERRAYEDALNAAGGNRTKAMQQLGVSRRTFYKKFAEFGLR